MQVLSRRRLEKIVRSLVKTFRTERVAPIRFPIRAFEVDQQARDGNTPSLDYCQVDSGVLEGAGSGDAAAKRDAAS